MKKQRTPAASEDKMVSHLALEPDKPGMNNNIGSMLLSAIMVQDALQMPDDVRIVGCEWDFNAQCIRLYMEHPEFPAIEEDRAIPLYSPTCTVDYEGEPTERYPVTWDWHIKALTTQEIPP